HLIVLHLLHLLHFFLVILPLALSILGSKLVLILAITIHIFLHPSPFIILTHINLVLQLHSLATNIYLRGL
ncbi:MAG: hypothetical protein ACK55Z_22590, partial [bacterium]